MQTSGVFRDYIKPFFKNLYFRISANRMGKYFIISIYYYGFNLMQMSLEHRIRSWIRLHGRFANT